MNATHPPPLSLLLGRLLAAAALLLIAVPAAAEVQQSAADAFLVAHELEVRAAPREIFAALGQVGRWWNGVHSWSKSAANLHLDLEAGGCFCERWPEGSVEHARVVFVRRDEALTLRGGIGPLLALALDGVLTFTFAPTEAGTTRLNVSYRVTGDSLHTLESAAPAVDGVIGEQAARLKAFVETGRPEPAAAADPPRP